MSYTNQLLAPTDVPIASARSCRDTNDSKWSCTIGSEIGGAFDLTRAQNRIACRPSLSACRVTVVFAQRSDLAIWRWAEVAASAAAIRGCNPGRLR